MRSQREHRSDGSARRRHRIKRWIEKTDGVVMGKDGSELQLD